MGGYSSPLLDQYNRDGVMTPSLQRAMDLAKQKLPPEFQLPDQNQQPQGAAAMPALKPPGSEAPVPRFQMGTAPAGPMGATPQTPAPQMPAPSPAATAHQQDYARITAPPRQSGDPLQHTKADTGVSGVDQIHRSWLRTPLKILGALGDTFLPQLTMNLPGTQLHHEMLENHSRGLVDFDQKQQTSQDESRLHNAQAAEQESLPELHRTQTELAGTKAETDRQRKEAETANEKGKLSLAELSEKHKRDLSLLSRGMKLDETGNEVPIPEEELPEKDKASIAAARAHNELQSAQAGLAQAKAHNIPEQLRIAEERVRTAQGNQSVALQRLALSNKQYEMHAHGTENGVPLPGTTVDSNGQTVGSVFQANVRPTTTQRDAAGRADTMLSLDARIRAALSNPELAKGTGPLMGRLSEIENRAGTLPHDLSELKNDLVSYGAFQAGLHPVRGIGALEYFDKVMGGLGQNPEQLLGKLDSNKATAASVKNVGDVKHSGSGPAAGDLISVQIPGSPVGQIHASQKDAFLKKYPTAKVVNGR